MQKEDLNKWKKCDTTNNTEEMKQILLSGERKDYSINGVDMDQILIFES